MIVEPEANTSYTITGPGLNNNWGGFTDTQIAKSSGENYVLVFSLENGVF
jgi:hypothetical protein